MQRFTLSKGSYMSVIFIIHHSNEINKSVIIIHLSKINNIKFIMDYDYSNKDKSLENIKLAGSY